MKRLCELESLDESLRGGAVSIGNFDGVHLGHAQIIAQLVAMGRQVDGPTVVFTFDPHPLQLLRPASAPPPLTGTDRKAELVSQLGVDAMIAFPTDMHLLQLSPRDFFDQIVCQRLDARAVVEGPNFFFGRDRAGTIEVLRKFSTEAQIALDIVPAVEVDDKIVSSSRVRQLLADGDVDTVRRLLTQPYRLRGMVTHGAGRGADIGFPTANLEAIDTILPAAGVYAGRGTEGNRTWPAAINIGPNPTFGDETEKVEVHLSGCNESLYGRVLEVDFLSRLRDIRRFENTDALKLQLADDVTTAKRIATGASYP